MTIINYILSNIEIQLALYIGWVLGVVTLLIIYGVIKSFKVKNRK